MLDAGADIVGMNCLRPPEHMLWPMEEMRKAVTGYLACQPVGYRTPKSQPDFTSLPEFPYGLDPLQLNRKEFGVNYNAVIEAGGLAIGEKVKLELAVGRGKEQRDKRRDIAKRDAQRDIERALRRRR